MLERKRSQLVDDPLLVHLLQHAIARIYDVPAPDGQIVEVQS
jgi:hypothetical protein